jgi:hypothetical protein
MGLSRPVHAMSLRRRILLPGVLVPSAIRCRLRRALRASTRLPDYRVVGERATGVRPGMRGGESEASLSNAQRV